MKRTKNHILKHKNKLNKFDSKIELYKTSRNSSFIEKNNLCTIINNKVKVDGDSLLNITNSKPTAERGVHPKTTLHFPDGVVIVKK